MAAYTKDHLYWINVDFIIRSFQSSQTTVYLQFIGFQFHPCRIRSWLLKLKIGGTVTQSGQKFTFKGVPGKACVQSYFFFKHGQSTNLLRSYPGERGYFCIPLRLPVSWVVTAYFPSVTYIRPWGRKGLSRSCWGEIFSLDGPCSIIRAQHGSPSTYR